MNYVKYFLIMAFSVMFILLACYQIKAEEGISIKQLKEQQRLEFCKKIVSKYNISEEEYNYSLLSQKFGDFICLAEVSDAMKSFKKPGMFSKSYKMILNFGEDDVKINFLKDNSTLYVRNAQEQMKNSNMPDSTFLNIDISGVDPVLLQQPVSVGLAITQLMQVLLSFAALNNPPDVVNLMLGR